MWSFIQLAGGQPVPQLGSSAHNELISMMSFSSGSGAKPASMLGQRRLNSKMNVVNNLLSMLGTPEGRKDMSATLLSMSSCVESCLMLRQSGFLPILMQLIHAPGQDPETRDHACRALYNIIHAKSDEKCNKREARVLRLLEQLRDYCQMLRISLQSTDSEQDLQNHPGAAVTALMKLSFDESHRLAMCQLGGLHAVAELIEMDHAAHGANSAHQNCINLRRYSGMALTNLTFGDSKNKALLCSFQLFMKALVSQLKSPSDDLRQVTASVLRNLSWKANGRLITRFVTNAKLEHDNLKKFFFIINYQELMSMTSFSSGSEAKPASILGQRRLNSKIDVVNNLFSISSCVEAV